MKRFYLLMLLAFFVSLRSAQAQDDPEFPRGFIFHLKLHNGLVTTFRSGNDLYAGGLQLVPQVTIIEHRLRAGINAGIFYTGQKWNTAIGPTLSVKLKTFSAGQFGSAGNLHLTADHLWGSNGHRLLGGGLHIDLLNRFSIGITAHRDYGLHAWWLQQSIGIRISKKRNVKDTF